MFLRTPDLQSGALPLGQRRFAYTNPHTNKKPGAARHPGSESYCCGTVSMHAHCSTHSRCPAPGAARSLHAKQCMRRIRAKLRQRAPGAHVSRYAPAYWARPWITAAVTSVLHLFPAVAGPLLLSHPSNESDFNSCTLACREAPCGCVTAPPCSPRGGMGLGTSAAALPLFLRASIETCCWSVFTPSLRHFRKQKSPEPCGVAGPVWLET